MRLIVHEGDKASTAFWDAIEEVAADGSLSIVVPYFNPDILLRLIEGKEWRLITDCNECFNALTDRSKQRLIEFCKNNHNQIHHKDLLHAKVFIGKEKALLGSANLTDLGFGRRAEAAVLFEGDIVIELREWYSNLWNESEEIPIDAKRITKIKERSVSERTTSEPLFSKNNHRTQTKLHQRSKKKATKTPTTEAEHRKRLLAAIRRSPSKEWIEGYFDLMKRAIEIANLDQYPERFVTSCTKGLSINLTINRGFSLTANHQHINSIGFILPEDIDPDSYESMTKKHYNKEPFKLITKSKGSDPYIYVSFVMDYNDINLISNELLAKWETIVKAQPQMGYSPLPNVKAVHNPLVYRAAVDLDYRKQLLDEAFGD